MREQLTDSRDSVMTISAIDETARSKQTSVWIPSDAALRHSTRLVQTRTNHPRA
jgi:hypothetical protein